MNTHFTTMTLSTYFLAVANALTPTVGTAKPGDNKTITIDLLFNFNLQVLRNRPVNVLELLAE